MPIVHPWVRVVSTRLPGRTPIRSDVPATVPERSTEILKLGYDAALAALVRQDAALTSIRNRATGLLSAATIGTAFATSVGLLNTDPSKGVVLPAWVSFTFLGLVVVIGLLSLASLWPVKWDFFPNADPYVAMHERGRSTEAFFLYALRHLDGSIETNDRALTSKTRLLSAQVVLVTLHLVLIVLVFALPWR